MSIHNIWESLILTQKCPRCSIRLGWLVFQCILFDWIWNHKTKDMAILVASGLKKSMNFYVPHFSHFWYYFWKMWIKVIWLTFVCGVVLECWLLCLTLSWANHSYWSWARGSFNLKLTNLCSRLQYFLDGYNAIYLFLQN